MTSKNQGEGDYESARHYNDETKRFVEQKTQGGKQDIKGSASQASDELTPEEQEALRHAKRGDQDQRDAAAFRDMEKPHKK
jgi:hypothetical protein